MKNLFAFFIIMGSFPFLNAQETPFHYFNTIGKFNEPINQIAQDKEGRLLLATQNGLISYNGYTSKKYPIQNSTNKEIVNLFSTQKGVFVLNNHGQLFQLIKDTLQLIKIAGLSSEIKDLDFEDYYFILLTDK